MRITFLLLLVLVLVGCSEEVVPPAPEAVPVPPPTLVDDLPFASFLEGLRSQISALEQRGEEPMTFGSRSVPADEYRAALIGLYTFARSGRKKTSEVIAYVKEHFEFIAFHNPDGDGAVRVTAYYEPILNGSLRPSDRFSQPLYRKPSDLAVEKRNGQVIRRRRTNTGGYVDQYYSRKEIDLQGVLKGRNLEICYVDPLDAFLLQTQGSGTIRLDDGAILRLNFSEKNGLPYIGLGKLSEGKIPGTVRSLRDLERGLRAMPTDELRRVLAGNPSYIFFTPSTRNAVTAIGRPAIAGRTIATDKNHFPKGALAYLIFGKPIFDTTDADLPAQFRATGRFVLDQDVGSAILGPTRLDLFIGQGDEAKREAGAINGSGRLLYLFPRSN